MNVCGISNGAIIRFEKCTNYVDKCSYFMKVVGNNKMCGVVRLVSGTYTPVTNLHNYGIDLNSAILVAENLDKFYYEDD